MGEITCRNLTWNPGRAENPVLKGLTITFSQGGFYAVMGPNGSGKTSFLKHIMRFLPLMEGEIRFDARKIGEYKQMEFARKTAFVPQNANLDSNFSAYDIVMMGRNPYVKRFSGPAKEDIQKVEEAMQMVSVSGLRTSSMNSLSGGESQRVAAARAIAQDTPWIFLDEPAASLDIKHQIQLMEILKELNEQRGTSIIIVLHDINLAAAYCKDILMMKDGSICFTGKTEEVLNTKNLEAVYDIPFVCMRHPVSGRSMYMPA